MNYTELLPPLPEHAARISGDEVTFNGLSLIGGGKVFSESQLRAAQLAAIAAAAPAIRRAERDRCAAACEAIAERHLNSGRYVSVIADHSVRAGGQVDGSEECADAIRALPEEP